MGGIHPHVVSSCLQSVRGCVDSHRFSPANVQLLLAGLAAYRGAVDGALSGCCSALEDLIPERMSIQAANSIVQCKSNTSPLPATGD